MSTVCYKCGDGERRWWPKAQPHVSPCCQQPLCEACLKDPRNFIDWFFPRTGTNVIENVALWECHVGGTNCNDPVSRIIPCLSVTRPLGSDLGMHRACVTLVRQENQALYEASSHQSGFIYPYIFRGAGGPGNPPAIVGVAVANGQAQQDEADNANENVNE